MASYKKTTLSGKLYSTSGGLFLPQRKITIDLLDRDQMFEANGISTPTTEFSYSISYSR